MYSGARTRGPDTYCDALNATLGADAGEGDGAFVPYTPNRVPLGLYRYSDGSEDREVKIVQPVINSPYIQYPVDKYAKAPGGANSQLVTELVSNGGAPTHQRYRVSCNNGQDEQLIDEYWVMMPTPEAVADIGGLFGKVIAQIYAPDINFIDPDLDYGWLWVRVEHHVNVAAPQPITESLTLTNQLGQSASASITATPVEISIVVEEEAGEQYLDECDMAQATSAEGCRIKFTHATAISDDDLFHGEVRVGWQVTSTSGKYNGLGPFYTVSKFSTQVGEAMAVTRYDL